MNKLIRITLRHFSQRPPSISQTTKLFAQTNSNEFKPFNVAVSKFTVNDYSEWKSHYDEDTTIRKSNGMKPIAVAHSIYNPKKLITAYVISDVEKVKTYVGSNTFQEKAKRMELQIIRNLTLFKSSVLSNLKQIWTFRI
ncbi:MAG: hypothetical protein IPN15_16485 [Saprospiraceae bacterium]|nr:hypothetical protein [Candidatus Vicinibacter affinis]